MNVVDGEGVGENASVTLQAGVAKDLLDRAGHGAIQKSMGLVGHLTEEDINRMKKKVFDRDKKSTSASASASPEI